MLISGLNLSSFPVLSLHIGGEIGVVELPIIDPNDLRIVAFELSGPLIGKDYGPILETQDIREFSDIGMIIDSSDVLVNPGEVIRLDDIRKIDFSLIGKKVVTKKGTKLGKVADYTVNTDDFMIAQIVVQRPIMKAFLDPELLIGRSEVISVDDEKIIVRDEEAKLREKAVDDFTPNFVNPFRSSGALSLEESSSTSAPITKE